MITEWLSASVAEVGIVALSALVVFLAVLGATRIAGLRSFSKMSGFDFATTVAIGSAMATIAVTDASLVSGLVALAVFYVAQVVVAALRRRSGVAAVIDNTPVLLMAGERMVDEHLRATKVTEKDVRAKLREANVTHPSQILAVVLETTGDVSVLHGNGPLDPGLLDGVRGAGLLSAER